MAERVAVCGRVSVYIWLSVCVSVGTIGMRRCVMKTNELLSILRACLWLCVHEREKETIERTGVDVGG